MFISKIKTQLNESHAYLMTSDTVTKCVSVYEQETANLRKTIKLIEGGLNISFLEIDIKNKLDISTFHKFLKKLNTNVLKFLSLYELDMTLKDLFRLIYQ